MLHSGYHLSFKLSCKCVISPTQKLQGMKNTFVLLIALLAFTQCKKEEDLTTEVVGRYVMPGFGDGAAVTKLSSNTISVLLYTDTGPFAEFPAKMNSKTSFTSSETIVTNINDYRYERTGSGYLKADTIFVTVYSKRFVSANDSLVDSWESTYEGTRM